MLLIMRKTKKIFIGRIQIISHIAHVPLCLGKLCNIRICSIMYGNDKGLAN